MRLNQRSIQRHGGIGFWMNADGSRSAEYLGRTFAATKVASGWECDGQSFRTLAEVASHIVNSH